MTHKKYQTIRWISLLCNTLLIGTVLVCSVFAIINDNVNRIIPLIIVVGVIYLFLILFLGRIFCGIY